MIPLFKVYVAQNATDKMGNECHLGEALGDVLASGYIAEGENVKEFEKYLREYLHNKNVLTTNSCTSSLQIALRLAGVKAGDKVFSSSMTCLATNAPIETLSATPVWVDVDPIHGMITPDALISSIKANPYIKVLIYVCWGGDLGPLREVNGICLEHGIKLIVDAAQAFGTYAHRGILGDGTYGDYICFSFQAIKQITTADGGAIAFRNGDDMARANRLKWFGLDRDGFRTTNGEIDWRSDVPEIGFKMHMNNVAGCIGTAQMKDPGLSARLSTYIMNDLHLTKALVDVMQRSWRGPTAAWVSTFIGDNIPELLDFLRAKDIHASQMHVNNDVYSGFHADPIELPGVKAFMEKHISLPCGWWVTDEDVQYMADCIKGFYE